MNAAAIGAILGSFFTLSAKSLLQPFPLGLFSIGLFAVALVALHRYKVSFIKVALAGALLGWLGSVWL